MDFKLFFVIIDIIIYYLEYIYKNQNHYNSFIVIFKIKVIYFTINSKFLKLIQSYS